MDTLNKIRPIVKKKKVYLNQSKLRAQSRTLGLSEFLSKEQNHGLQVEISSTSLNCSIETLMEEIKPVVTQKRVPISR